MSLVNTYGECNDECDRAPSQKLFRTHRRIQSKQRKEKDRKLTNFGLWEFGQDGKSRRLLLELFTRRNLSRLSVPINS